MYYFCTEFLVTLRNFHSRDSPTIGIFTAANRLFFISLILLYEIFIITFMLVPDPFALSILLWKEGRNCEEPFKTQT